MSALPPGSDTDPSTRAPEDVHEVVAPELHGPVLDVGCGDGRLASLLVDQGVAWIGLDSSPRQPAANPHRPERYSRSSFDAKEAAQAVRSVFDDGDLVGPPDDGGAGDPAGR